MIRAFVLGYRSSMATKKRTSIEYPEALLHMIDQLRALRLIPRGEKLRTDTPTVIWLATKQAKQMLDANPQKVAPAKRR